MLEALTLLPLAGAATYFGVDGVRRWALRHHALDIPNQRSSHSRPTPRGGGLAVAVVTVLGWVALGIAFQPAMCGSALWAYALGAGMIALVSWFDDLYSLSPLARLAVHALAAFLAVFVLGYWQRIPLPTGQNLGLGYAGPVITAVWIIGLTNAYNFMDGSDGIAAIQAVVAAAGWACLGWLAGAQPVVNLSLLLAAASLGFLLHNWPPAGIFMGDVGSAFLGYSFAVLPLIALRENGPLAAASPLIGLLLVWPFVFDAALTFLRRLARGEHVLAPHRSHLYQRLIIAGYSHRFVLLLYGGLATVGVPTAILWLRHPTAAFWATLAILPSLAWWLWRFVAQQEQRARDAESLPQVLPFPAAPGRKRRAA
jgi:UDP-N-acetylmuramyl pentapeptide phosphotransferase/UDP-N-acetylglucosamine-1-phosphate transferase